MQKAQKNSILQFIRQYGKTLFCWSALVLNVVLVVLFFQAKNNYHIDELFSFGHANSTQGAFLQRGVTSRLFGKEFKQHIWYRWIPGHTFHTWLTVQPDESFRYKHIVDNLKVGVHPPLFYILLHTVCSFTPDVMSKWQGAALNIPLWLLLLWLLFRLSNLFFKDSFYSWCVVLFYAYSEVGFSTVLFIRGYLLQTVCAVWLIDQVTRLLRENKASTARMLCIGCAATLGMLTHYNSIILAALVGLIAGIILCARKQWKLCADLAATLLISFLLFVTLFPPAFDVLINSNHGRGTLSHYRFIQNVFWGLLNGLNVHAKEYLIRLWHLSKHYWFLFYVVLAGAVTYKYLRTRTDRLIDWLLGLILALWSYFAFTMPYMGEFQVRYSMLVYPLAALVTVWYLVFLITPLIRQPKEKWTKRAVITLIMINAGINTCYFSSSPFAFQEEFPFQAEDLAGKRVIVQGFISGFDWADLFTQAKEVYWTPQTPDWEKFSKALDSADILFRKSSRQTLPEQIFLLPEKESQLLTAQKQLWLLRSFRKGINHYEEYLIIDTPGYSLRENFQNQLNNPL